MLADARNRDGDPIRPKRFNPSISDFDVLVDIDEAGTLRFGKRIYDALAASGYAIRRSPNKRATMQTQSETLLQQLRDGSYGASGYAAELVWRLIQNAASETSDPIATRRIARRLQVVWPAFVEGVLPRLNRADGQYGM